MNEERPWLGVQGATLVVGPPDPAPTKEPLKIVTEVSKLRAKLEEQAKKQGQVIEELKAELAASQSENRSLRRRLALVKDMLRRQVDSIFSLLEST